MTGWFAKTSGQFGGAIGLRATTVSGQNVNLKMALWKGPANGVGATRITDAGQYIGFSGGASFTTTAEDVIFQFTEFFSPPKSIVMNNEYLFFQVGVQISIASGSNNADALFRVGSNASGGVLYFFSTPDFFERSPPFAVYGQSINRGSSF